MKKLIFIIFTLFIGIYTYSQELYKVFQSTIKFTSDAPLELIQAESNQLNGLLNISDRSFAFRVPMNTFEGFNSALQRTHFNENYIESAKYPNTSFAGKIIEEVDLSAPGTYKIRGKGKFNCHGVQQERIIRCTIEVESNKIKIDSEFSVLLEDHDISIPSVVSQKIAEEITVMVNIELIPK